MHYNYAFMMSLAHVCHMFYIYQNFNTIGKSVQSLAETFTTENIATFLNEIELPQYANNFRREKINGEVLLDLVANPEVLAELGVMNHLHQMKIIHLFQKKLGCAVVMQGN